MVVPIVINTNDIYSQFDINPESLIDIMDSIAKRLAVGYARQLEIEAQENLHQTRQLYIKNIRLIDTGRLEGSVMLDYSKHPLIKMIEEGASPFDIKQGLLKSPKVKIGKNGGRYITVPFRHGVPTTIGDSDVFNNKMPEKVHDVIKSKAPSIPTSGGGSRTAGLKLSEIPTEYQTPAKRAEIKDDDGKTLFKEYEHKTSIYQGMTKQQDGVTGQNTYQSFRRVSDNSDPDSWIHGGIEQYDLMNKALANFDQVHEVSMGLDNGLALLGFNNE